MKPVMVFTILLGAVTAAVAQVQPAATGPGTYLPSGNLNYALRYAQINDIFSGGQGNDQRSTLSGDLSYTSVSERNPFDLTVGAGYNWRLSGTGYGNGPFENLSLMQSHVARNWSVRLGDDLSYRRESPSTGFSGVSGSGEPIGPANLAPSTSQSILTVNTVTIYNSVTALYSHTLRGSITSQLGGGSELLRYPNGNGDDTNVTLANAGLTERLSARSSFMAQYELGLYSYSGTATSFVSNTGLLGWDRRWNRRISSHVAAGPQWIGSSGSILVPPSTGASVQAGLTDMLRAGALALTYTRGVNGGSGYFYGAELDQIDASLSKGCGRLLTVELAGGYRRTSPLTSQGITSSKYGEFQATRNIGRTLSAYVSYTGTAQSSSTQLPANVLSDVWQVISFGVGYTSRRGHLGQ